MDVKKVLVSFIIPLYNTKIDDFNDCIKSIENQKLECYEIIVVDDGSEYSYARMIDEYYGNYKNVIIVHQLRRGVSAARNEGIKHAKGKYVTFVDADDILVEGGYKIGVELIEKLELDCVVGKISKVKRKEVANSIEQRGNEIKIFNSMDKDYINGIFGVTAANLFDDNIWRIILESPVAKIIELAALRNVSFPEEISISEDTIWNYKFAVESQKKIGIVNCELYYYIQNEYSTLNHFSKELPENVIKATELISKEINNNNDISSQFLLWLIGKLQQIVENYLNPKCDFKTIYKTKQIRSIAKNEAFSLLYDYSRLLTKKDRLKTHMFRTGIAIYYYKLKGMW